MKTDYLRERRAVVLSETFRQDMDRLKAVLPEALGPLAKSYVRYWIAEEGSAEREAIAQAAEDLSAGDLDSIESLFRVTNFLREPLSDEDASPEDVCADLRALGVVSPQDEEPLREFLKALKLAYEQEAAAIQWRRQALRRGIASFVGLDTVAEMRGVFVEEHRFGDPADGYEPKVRDVVPTAILRVRVQSGDEGERFSFQAGKEHLQQIIEALRASLKELEALEAHWQGPAKPSAGDQDGRSGV